MRPSSGAGSFSPGAGLDLTGLPSVYFEDDGLKSEKVVASPGTDLPLRQEDNFWDHGGPRGPCSEATMTGAPRLRQA